MLRLSKERNGYGIAVGGPHRFHSLSFAAFDSEDFSFLSAARPNGSFLRWFLRSVDVLRDRFFRGLFVHEAVDVGLEVRRNGDVPGLAHQEPALEIPRGVRGSRLSLEEPPDLRGGGAPDLPEFHQDPGEVLRRGEAGDGLVGVEFLPSEFPAGKPEDHELVLPVFLPEPLEPGVFAVGHASLRGDVRRVDDLPPEILHRDDRPVPPGSGQ